MIKADRGGAPALWVVSPDNPGAGRLKRVLERAGWRVSVHDDCRSWAETVSGRSGLALLDWDCLPGPQPRSLSALKARLPGIAIMINSAESLSDSQVIELLESGADDYFPPAVNQGLMLAKLRSHLRRLPPAAARPDVVLSPAGDVRLDRVRRDAAVRMPGGRWERLVLTSKEFHILGLLLEHAGAALERTVILESFDTGLGEKVLPATVDKHVEALRRKMGRHGVCIRAVYGVGYTWRAEVKI